MLIVDLKKHLDFGKHLDDVNDRLSRGACGCECGIVDGKHVDGEGSMMMVTYQGEHSRQLRAVYLASLLLPD